MAKGVPVVFVTGASSGLGRDLCLDLAKAGCRIIAAARRLDRLHSLCHQINTLYRTVRAVITGYEHNFVVQLVPWLKVS
ncbi:NAD(P)-binding rossmann-fold protein [Trifolium pratense]|uniref:NAD(P)-binding rossmann-fold protein n=1 Tax=Trifolium pratense TaxID=57577 RepID=A0A2K3JTV8_TRIPR|nr:NAD(P)-binding rossmann-fold protein [Trifolium pratense]